MDSMPYPENECETALGISARLWDEDKLDLIAAKRSSMGSVGGGGDKKDRLEFLTQMEILMERRRLREKSGCNQQTINFLEDETGQIYHGTIHNNSLSF